MNCKQLAILLSKNILLRNVNKTHFKKDSLFIYVTKPFVKKNGKVTHPNYYKARIISRCLKECGYNVDVIYSEYTRKLDLRRYSFIIGMGEGYTNTYERASQNCKRIYLATGTCFTTANQRELERWVSLYQKNKGFIGAERFEKMKDPVKTLRSMYDSDAIIAGGDNEWVMKSYEWIPKRKYIVGSIALTNFTYSDMNRKICEARHRVLFLCGNGCIHKGLDIIVDAFGARMDFELYIVGNVEEGFQKAYREEIRKGNIVLERFQDAKSEAFRELCSRCGFIINMSCSESCCTSVLTGMATGLIPIITEAEGINIEDSGYLLKNADSEEIRKALDRINLATEEELIDKMKKASDIIVKKYSQYSFYVRFKEALENILLESGGVIHGNEVE